MRRIFYLLLLLLPVYATAQETIVRKTRLYAGIKEYITVLKNDPNTRHGVYRAEIDKNHPLAVGGYKDNVKTGTWTFYDDNAQVIQRYNYDHKQLVSEAIEDTSSNCRYLVDYTINPGDTTSRPIRVGDRYYGYINYLRLFKFPKDWQEINPNFFEPVIELLVSPGGRLADFSVHLQSTYYEQRDFHLNFSLLSEEDKIFIPAMINHKPVACRIFIKCKFDGEGRLRFEDI